MTRTWVGRRRELTTLLAAAAAVALLAVVVTVALTGREPQRTVAASPTTPESVEPRARASELTVGPLMSTSKPTRVIVPKLHVDTAPIPLGLQPNGAMQVPDDAATVGWFTKAPTPGALGPAVLAAHINWRGRDGAFADLHTLKRGDTITVNRADHSAATFAVTTVARYAKDEFPTRDVYGPINHAGLRLITCGGDFDENSGHYRDNIVVYAALKRADT
ncbi:class F sortase [Asanoa siamensis]|uniref:Class F sortase n=1 Tax=Asanoa siamensis TaxID=926357 RepID=A0ABQ4CXD8_9ACTN|nr:class F sortase [Asanoa siamensis]GIF75961.1 class F sortase [Asanoa siamensis]